MKPKQEAEKLFQSMYWQMFKIQYNGFETEKKQAARQCALIAVDLIIEYGIINTIFWVQVKKEVENLSFIVPKNKAKKLKAKIQKIIDEEK